MQIRDPGRNFVVVFVSLLFAFFVFVSLGCGVKNQIADVRLNSADYSVVFDSALTAVRAAGFRLDRVDRRFGVITSEPLDAGSVVEPWRNWTATPAQALESTFNYERRLVRITFEPASGMRGAGGVAATDSGVGEAVWEPVLAQVEPRGMRALAAEEIASYEGTLQLNVQCMIERAHRPGRRIESTTTRRISYTEDPSLAARGIGREFWEPLARDPFTEQHLLRLLVGNVAEGILVVEGIAGEGG